MNESTQQNDTPRDWTDRIWEKYSDKGDERFGLAKHNNTVLQNILDDASDEFRILLADSRRAPTAEYIRQGMNRERMDARRGLIEELEGELPKDVTHMHNGSYIYLAPREDCTECGFNAALAEVRTLLAKKKEV